MSKSSRIKLLATAATVVRAATRPGAPSVTVRLQAVPRLVRATLAGRYAGTSAGRLGLLAAAVAYVVSPVDLLPEAFLPVVGAADDAVVISWALRTLLDETDRFLAWEAGQGARRAQEHTGGGVAQQVRALRPASGAAPRVRGQAREAATTYVLESVRRRLER